MKIVQPVGRLEPQFQEIVQNAVDRRQFAEVVTPGADVEFTIPHRLGIVPLGFLPILQDKAASFYLSATPRTVESIFLKCNVATVTARILVF